MQIGYARCSTQDQHLDLQIMALEKAGCLKEGIFCDHMSGSKMDRPGLKDALSHLRCGDTLVIWKLDRLARSVKGLVDLVAELEGKGINFCSITDQIETNSPAGRFFFHVMSSLAQMERELIGERTRAGLDAARVRGRVGGRKRLMTTSKIASAKQLLLAGTPPRDVAKNLGVSIPTLYRWVPASDRA